MARSGFAYPREGRHLLPALLSPYFGDDLLPAPARLRRAARLRDDVRVRDLDERIWSQLPNEVIKELIQCVVAVVRAGISARRLDGAREKLFDPPIAIDAMRIPQRARNALIHHGVSQEGLVQGVELRDLAHTRHVGSTTLLQIISAEEEARESNAAAPTAAPASEDALTSPTETRRPSRAVRREAAQLSKRRWSRKLGRGDPRLGREVAGLVPGAMTAHAAAELLPAFTYDPVSARRKAEAIRRLIERGDALARLQLEDELDGVLGALTVTERQRAALRRRFGWDGLPPGTLEVAAQEISVTRERVRQIEVKFRKRLTDAWTPALDRAIRIVGEMNFATARDIQDALREAKIIRTDFPLASLVRTARLFGRTVPDLTEHEGVLAPADFAKALSDVQGAARRLTNHWGTTTVAELTSVLAEKGAALEEEVVRKTLAMIDEVRFLDDEHDWFWMAGSTRNRLLNFVAKILSVAGSINLGELRDGVGRHHRMHGFRPPRAVLARLCADTGLYRIDGDQVSGIGDLPDWHDTLSGNEQLLADALFHHGPVMRRVDLEDLVVRDGGMSRASFYIYLTYSPILQRYAHGVYGLRGAQVSAAEVSALIPPIVRSKVLGDHGWTQDRRVWIVYRLSPASVTSGVLSVPAMLAPVLHGQFSLLTEDNTPVGTLVIEETRLWGVSPFYRRRGVEAGDHLLLVFNLNQRKAHVDAGDETVALAYQGGE
jgi:hypothetical protein